MIKNDASYKEAIAYIETNENIKSLVGNITGYNFFPQGGFNYTGGYGDANYTITVYGDKTSLKLGIELKKNPVSDWEIVDVHYQNPTSDQLLG